MLTIAIIGTPQGFKHRAIGDNINPYIRLENELDLPTSKINCFEGEEIFCCKKLTNEGKSFLIFSNYCFAQERHSNRTGGYYGASIILTDNKGESKFVIESLRYLSAGVKAHCMQGNTFVNNLTAYPFDQPNRNLDNFFKSLQPYNVGKLTSEHLFVSLKDSPFSESDFLDQIFEKPEYVTAKTVFFSSGKRVYEYVQKIGAFSKIISLATPKPQPVKAAKTDFEPIEGFSSSNQHSQKKGGSSIFSLPAEPLPAKSPSDQRVELLESKFHQMDADISKALNILDRDIHNQKRLQIVATVASIVAIILACVSMFRQPQASEHPSVSAIQGLEPPVQQAVDVPTSNSNNITVVSAEEPLKPNPANGSSSRTKNRVVEPVTTAQQRKNKSDDKKSLKKSNAVSISEEIPVKSKPTDAPQPPASTHADATKEATTMPKNNPRLREGISKEVGDQKPKDKKEEKDNSTTPE